MKYDPKKIEAKWQRNWAKSRIYEAKDFSNKPKWYSLVEFPYPSGEGLHTGHIRSNTAMDIISRKRRMEGFNVLYPMGWDAFGLPTENYAIKTGVHPAKVTKKNTDTFRRQLKSLGFSFDWTREINTTDPAYYKWTQWIFLQLFQKGLAYKQKSLINWCPSCKIGLANEEVVGGNCERCGTPVIKKEKEQWMLAITKYADRLDKDLDLVDYLPEIKTQQRNWIGRSEGAEIGFALNTKHHYVLLHGYTATPKSNFRPWLKKELEKRGHSVEVPTMPNTKDPNVAEQVEYVLTHCHFDDNTILLGHSLGSVVAIKVAERLKKPLLRLILVAGFMQPKFKDHSRPFEKNFDWTFDTAKIKKNVGQVLLLRASNDSAVPQERSEYIKQQIGGTIYDFQAEDNHACGRQEPFILDKCLDKIEVFTTRVDTLFGVTYVVLAPEHPLVEELLPVTKNKQAVKNYIKKTLSETDTERLAENKEKTGVKLEGIKAINPANGEEVPIFIADYVLASYGTGAVMAVPAHDERDWEFAKKYKLPIREVILAHCGSPMRDGFKIVKREHADCYVRNPKNGKFICLEWNEKYGWVTPVGGGIEGGEDMIEAGKREIKEESGYLNVKFIRKIGECFGSGFATHKNENRFSHVTALLFELENEERVEIDQKELDNHVMVWKDESEVANFLNISSAKYLWSLYLKEPKAYVDEGILINSGQFNGMENEKAKKAIVKFVGGKFVIKYKLRDWIFSRQRYWGEPIPLVYCEKDGWVSVPEKDLPIKLPKVKNYQPTDTGESPLAHIDKWVKTKCPKCGRSARRETDTMPNWAGSSWYFLRYCDPHNNKEFASMKKLEYWMGRAGLPRSEFHSATGVDWYNGGMEHVTLHLLYSRFWNKFLFDLGLVPYSEPYQKRTAHGMILGEGGIKMSKSKGNVVNPDVTVKLYGADSLRVYEMFMGPFDQSIAWDTKSIIGSRRFLDKVWNLAVKVKKGGGDEDLEVSLNKLIKKVGEDIESMSFNTAISAMMIFINEAEKRAEVPTEIWENFLKILAPFAPHLAEELWSGLGHLPRRQAGKKSIHLERWPKVDENKIKDRMLKIIIQVNGKVRDEMTAEPSWNEAKIKKTALVREMVCKWVGDKEVKKVIYVTGKLINIVI